MRFEPGERKTVSLVEIGGKKLLSGGSGIGAGAFDESRRETDIKEMVEKRGFGHRKQENVREGTVPEMDREVVSGLLVREIATAKVCSMLPCLAQQQEIGSA